MCSSYHGHVYNMRPDKLKPFTSFDHFDVFLMRFSPCTVHHIEATMRSTSLRLLLVCMVFPVLQGFRLPGRSIFRQGYTSSQWTGLGKLRSMSLSSTKAAPSGMENTLDEEERLETDSVTDDSPTVDVQPPVDPFTKWFVGYSQVVSRAARTQSWVPHMQWARRSVLAQGLRGTELKDRSLQCDAMVEAEYTLLSEDRMSPVAQVLVIRANASEAVVNELAEEPLQASKSVSPWRVFEMKLEQHHCDPEMEDAERQLVVDSLTSDLHDPYIFLSLTKPSAQSGAKRKNSVMLDAEARRRGLEASLQFHLQCAQNDSTLLSGDPTAQPFLPLFNNASRVVALGQLVELGSPAEVAGQLLLFNARSRADALRYLKRDPVAASASSAAPPFDAMVRYITPIYGIATCCFQTLYVFDHFWCLVCVCNRP
jgi:hypothetical protein